MQACWYFCINQSQNFLYPITLYVACSYFFLNSLKTSKSLIVFPTCHAGIIKIQNWWLQLVKVILSILLIRKFTHFLFLQAASFCYQNLDENLFENYIDEKTKPITRNLEENMYAGQMDWKTCPKPTGTSANPQQMFSDNAVLSVSSCHGNIDSEHHIWTRTVCFTWN